MNTNAINRAGASVLANMVANKPDFQLLNINGNFISAEGDEEENELKSKLKKLDVDEEQVNFGYVKVTQDQQLTFSN